MMIGTISTSLDCSPFPPQYKEDVAPEVAPLDQKKPDGVAPLFLTQRFYLSISSFHHRISSSLGPIAQLDRAAVS